MEREERGWVRLPKRNTVKRPSAGLEDPGSRGL